MGDWRLFLSFIATGLKKVTPADVQRVATKYLKPSNRTLGPSRQPQNPTALRFPRS